MIPQPIHISQDQACDRYLCWVVVLRPFLLVEKGVCYCRKTCKVIADGSEGAMEPALDRIGVSVTHKRIESLGRVLERAVSQSGGPVSLP
jgi:hypothetical protein